MDWFKADKKGLSKLVAARDKPYILFELLQNSWDAPGASSVHVTLSAVPKKPLVEISVVDDSPEGFAELTDAFTLFAESVKKYDPTKRGRFNLGEKLVLALCEEARIHTTTGTIYFDNKGRRETRERRKEGTEFWGSIRMTREEHAQIVDASELLLVPPNIVTVFNGKLLSSREPIHTFEAILPTLTSDADGYLKPTKRKTQVRIYQSQGKSYLYEMGIPVVEIEFPWSVEVMQKIPVNADRDNVTPAYKRELSAIVVNAMHDRLEKEDAAIPIITESLSDERLTMEAQDRVLTLQYGRKRALLDPTDIEAGNRLVGQGYVVIPGSALPKGAAKLLRSNGLLQTTHEISPTPKPYSNDPNAPPRELLPRTQWSKNQLQIATYAEELGHRLLGRKINVSIDIGHPGQDWGACYGRGELTFNLATLGGDFFAHGPNEAVNDLLIHEFAHEFEFNHLSKKFYKALQKLGAQMVELALSDPEFFKNHGWRR